MRRAMIAATLLLSSCPKFDVKSVKDALDPYLPKLAFQNLDLRSIDFEGAEVDFVFRVDNPNPIDVKLSSFSWALSLAETRFASGDDQDGLHLPARDAARVTIPVGIVYTELYQSIRATRGQDEVPFRLKGDFGFDTPVGETLVPFDEEGSFPAPRAPKFRFQKLRVDSLDLLGHSATFEVLLGVTNEHGSSLSFEDFDYDLSLAGKAVADGRVADLGTVDGATESTLALPVEVDLLAVGTAVAGALTNKTALDADLEARMRVGTPFGALPLSIDERGRVSVE